MIAVVDYGAGNVMSVVRAFEALGAAALLTKLPADIAAADSVVLPGVGSFGHAVKNLRARGLWEPVRAAALGEKPFLGICLGMQLLFQRSEESPSEQGFAVVSGTVTRFTVMRKVPQVGFNTVERPEQSVLLSGLCELPYFYFVHSYCCRVDEPVTRYRASYGEDFDAGFERKNLFAVQFHPEKSGKTGLALLKNFMKATVDTSC